MADMRGEGVSRGNAAVEKRVAKDARGRESEEVSSESIAAVIARMLEQKGYTTHRHYVIGGVGGIKHVVDVFAVVDIKSGYRLLEMLLQKENKCCH